MPVKANWQNGEQFNASDANAVAEAVNAAYVKPSSGIPITDFTSTVQVTLGKADTAIQAVSAATISDSTATGRAVLTAADASAARTTLGVAYGTTAGTVAQGNDSRFSPTASSITDSTATGRSLITAVDAAAARTTLGVAYGSTGGTVAQGNDSRITGAEQTANKGQANGYAGLGSDGKVPVANLGSGTASASTFLRGDGAWSAVTSGSTRSVSTVTANATLGSAANTDYVVFSNISTIAAIPATGDGANYASTTAILHLNGTNNATSPITDNSAIASDWLVSGTAKLWTAQKKFGTASLLLDASGYIYPSAADSNFQFPGDFTIEFWYYCTTPASLGTYSIMSASGYSFALEYRPDVYTGTSKAQILFFGNNFLFASGNPGVSQENVFSQWNHIAVSRSGSTVRMFLNGTQTGSLTDSATYNGTNLKIGGEYSGWIDDFRITKAARYTSNFTAPTSAYADSGTAEVPAVPPILTMPTASGGNINLYTVQNFHSSESVTIGTTSSQTINGSSTYSLTNGSTVRLISNGSNWRII